MNNDFLIIIPAFNEEKSIGNVLKNIVKTYKVLVVDDGSTDNTRQIVDELIKKDNKNLIQQVIMDIAKEQGDKRVTMILKLIQQNRLIMELLYPG